MPSTNSWKQRPRPDGTRVRNDGVPFSAIKSRLPGYTAGDTDLAWSRITYWRALLTSAIDQPPYEPITSALVVRGIGRSTPVELEYWQVEKA